MIRNILTSSIAVAALAIAAPTVAKPGGGHGAGANANANADVNAGSGGPSGAALDARLNSMGAINASPRALERASPNSALNTDATTTTRVDGRLNSQGRANASANATGRANTNNMLRGNMVVSGHLTGLTTGMHVVDANGVMIGTVGKILTASGGRVVNVLVTPHEGSRTIPMSPNRLSISGGMVVTTQIRGRI